MLKQLDHIPPGLLDLEATQLQAVLGGPTLIHLEGRRQEPLLVTVLMHGNETTGWEAVRILLRPYASGEEELPVDYDGPAIEIGFNSRYVLEMAGNYGWKVGTL